MADDQDRISPQQGNGRGRHADPSENVLDLVQAAMNRQDDLRELIAGHLNEKVDLQARHLSEKAELRAVYEDKLRQAETARIDAIRAVDVGAGNRSAEVAAQAAAALAAQLVATADASRASTAAAASASVTSLAAALEPIQKDIRDLRDAQSRGQGGKEQVVETREVRSDTRQGLSTNYTALSVIIGALAIAIALYSALHH
jgi:hypothetical protein